MTEDEKTAEFTTPHDPPHPALPHDFSSMLPYKRAAAVSRWLSIPLNEAALLCRVSDLVSNVFWVVRAVTSGNFRYCAMHHAMAVRAYGFAGLDSGMCKDDCISDVDGWFG